MNEQLKVIKEIKSINEEIINLNNNLTEEKQKKEEIENNIQREEQLNEFNVNFVISENDYSEIESDYLLITLLLKKLDIDFEPIPDLEIDTNENNENKIKLQIVLNNIFVHDTYDYLKESYQNDFKKDIFNDEYLKDIQDEMNEGSLENVKEFFNKGSEFFNKFKEFGNSLPIDKLKKFKNFIKNKSSFINESVSDLENQEAEYIQKFNDLKQKYKFDKIKNFLYKNSDILNKEDEIKDILKSQEDFLLKNYEYIKNKYNSMRKILNIEKYFDNLLATEIGNLQKIGDNRCFSTTDLSYQIFELLKTNSVMNNHLFLDEFLNEYENQLGSNELQKFIFYNVSTIFSLDHIKEFTSILDKEFKNDEDNEKENITLLKNKFINKYNLYLKLYKYDTEFHQEKKEESLNPIVNLKNKITMLTVSDIRDTVMGSKNVSNEDIAKKISSKISSSIALLLKEMELNSIIIMIIEEVINSVMELIITFILEFISQGVEEILKSIQQELQEQSNKTYFDKHLNDLDYNVIINSIEKSVDDEENTQEDGIKELFNPLKSIESRLYLNSIKKYSNINSYEFLTVIDFPFNLFYHEETTPQRRKSITTNHNNLIMV